VVEPELGLFEVQVKGGIGQAVELHQPGLGKSPEGLDAVDVVLAVDELVNAMLDAMVFLVTQIDQAVVTPPVVGVDDAPGVHFAPNDGLKGGFGAIRDDLGVDLAAALKDAEDWLFAGRPPASFPLDALGAKVGFVDLDHASEGRFKFAHLGDAKADQVQVAVDRVAVQTGQGGYFGGLDVHSEILD